MISGGICRGSSGVVPWSVLGWRISQVHLLELNGQHVWLGQMLWLEEDHFPLCWLHQLCSVSVWILTEAVIEEENQLRLPRACTIASSHLPACSRPEDSSSQPREPWNYWKTFPQGSSDDTWACHRTRDWARHGLQAWATSSHRARAGHHVHPGAIAICHIHSKAGSHR